MQRRSDAERRKDAEIAAADLLSAQAFEQQATMVVRLQALVESEAAAKSDAVLGTAIVIAPQIIFDVYCCR